MITLEDVLYGLLGLAAYQILRAAARLATKALMPNFYAGLRNGSVAKFRAYFVFPVGFLVTAATAPVCIAAFSSTDPDIDRAGFISTRILTPREKVCLGSRAVLWTSELPLLSYSPDYVAHHVLSLASLALTLAKHQPLRPLYLIYAGLATELCSDVTALLRFHGLDHKTSRIYAIVGLANALGLLLLRAAPILAFTATYILPAASPVLAKAYTAAIVFYCGWLFMISFKQLVALGHIRLDWTQPPSIRVAGKLDISLFSLFLGLAMASVHTLTVIIYASTQTGPLSKLEVTGMAFSGACAAIIGLIGAYTWNWWVLQAASTTTLNHSKAVNRVKSVNKVADGGSSATLRQALDAQTKSTPVSNTFDNAGQSCTTPLRTSRFIKGISIQGSMLFSSIWIFLCPTLPLSIEKGRLIAALAVSFPLGEAFGRVGCYFAGCCGYGPIPNGKISRIPVQLLSAADNAVIFLSLVNLVRTSSLDIHPAGSIGLMSNASVRLAMNSLRRDSKGKDICTMNVFASCQFLVSAASLTRMIYASGASLFAACVAVSSFSIMLLLMPRLSKHLWYSFGSTALRSGSALANTVPWLRRPIIYVYAFGALFVAIHLSGNDREIVEGEAVRKAIPSNGLQLAILSDSDMLLSTVAIALLPSLLIRI